MRRWMERRSLGGFVLDKRRGLRYALSFLIRIRQDLLNRNDRRLDESVSHLIQAIQSVERCLDCTGGYLSTPEENKLTSGLPNGS